MLLIGLILIIGFSVASYVRSRNYDARFRFGKEIADVMDLRQFLENSYLGKFEFDEDLPNEEIRRDVEERFDRGVESRLALHLARTLPKWVLEAACKDIKSGQMNGEASYMFYIDRQITEFAEMRTSELSDLLSKNATSIEETDRRKRRR